MDEAATAAVVGVDEIGDGSNRWNFEQSGNLDDSTQHDSSNGFELADESEIIKRGSVFISSKKGLGWYVWRKRWVVLSRIALIFFKRDPGINPSGQLNIISGGILMKISGRVTIREDKKLLTISFPDVKRPFTFKTETSEDLHEWRAAMEYAITQAPSPAPTQIGPFCLWADKPPDTPSLLNPMSRALKETDGRPSILEKALCFLEEYGAKVEGILRISADLEEVHHRIKQFEQGNTDFDASEDAHVVVDCFKHILRELPSSPVPVGCCKELLKAYEIYHSETRINAFRLAIWTKLPEPNRLLFQRTMKMMYKISCTPENRMTPSAVAACMAPLLLRPILAGECDVVVETAQYNAESSQLLVVANAAKTAQAIIALILEEYHNIFSVGNSSRYSESVGSEDYYENDDSIDADLKNINRGNIDANSVNDWCKDENYEISSNDEPGRTSSFNCSDIVDHMDLSPTMNLSGHYDLTSSECHDIHIACKHPQGDGRTLQDQHERGNKMFSSTTPSPVRKPNQTFSQFLSSLKPKRDSTRKKLSVESIDSHAMEKQLEKKKIVLRKQLVEEAKVNESLQGSLEKRKQALIERYMMLNAHVVKLREQLQSENVISSLTRTEAEEFVARLNLTDSELPHAPSLLQHLCGPSDDPDPDHHIQNAKH